MMENSVYPFPRDEIEALAMLYVKNQDLSDLSPEELFDKYQEAYNKIKAHNKETYAKRHPGSWSV